MQRKQISDSEVPREDAGLRRSGPSNLTPMLSNSRDLGNSVPRLRFEFSYYEAYAWHDFAAGLSVSCLGLPVAWDLSSNSLGSPNMVSVAISGFLGRAFLTWLPSPCHELHRATFNFNVTSFVKRESKVSSVVCSSTRSLPARRSLQEESA